MQYNKCDTEMLFYIFCGMNRCHELSLSLSECSKLQSDYNELRFDVGTVLTVHKSFVFRLLIFKQHG